MRCAHVLVHDAVVCCGALCGSHPKLVGGKSVACARAVLQHVVLVLVGYDMYRHVGYYMCMHVM